MRFLITALIVTGSALMVFNISGFIRFSKFLRNAGQLEKHQRIMYVPIGLLIMFLIGYLTVGFFGKPDIVMAGILFGGSIFVFVMYRMLSDVTAQILEREEEKRKLLAEEESTRTKLNFLTSLSHEMRTPMNVILGIDRQALRSPDLPAETRKQFETIGLSARHLLDLINNLLDLNRLESGEYQLRKEAFLLADAIRQADAITRAEAEEKGLVYQSDISEEISGPYIGDDVRLKQVLLSVLNNAVKYTPAPGTVTFTAERISADEATERIRFTVKDTGIGISKDFLPKIFKAFEKEDKSSTDQFGGSGLSLAVTKRMVDQEGGSITVESVKNRGSVFTIELPIQKAVASEMGRADAESHLAGKLVLIVEDIPENAEIVADLLELEEVDSEHAENGKIALEMFENHSEGYYDAILMDLRMPVMDGLETARRIRAMNRGDAKKIPIIALTANALESDVRQTKEAGMNAHLAKPADSDELYAELNKWL